MFLGFYSAAIRVLLAVLCFTLVCVCACVVVSLYVRRMSMFAVIAYVFAFPSVFIYVIVYMYLIIYYHFTHFWHVFVFETTFLMI